MIDCCNYCKWDAMDTMEARDHCVECIGLEPEGCLPSEFELKDTVKELIKMLKVSGDI